MYQPRSTSLEMFTGRSGQQASFQNGNNSSMSPAVTDLHSRRSISDSVLSSTSQRPTTYNNKNTTYMMVNRSGGSTVRAIIKAINEICHEQEVSMDDDAVSAPEHELCILAQWAVDSYYRVVISGKGGIPAIARAMKAFPSNRGLQECCCLTLGNLCTGGNNNLVAVEQAGGVKQIILAMRTHSQSVAVMSAACDALRNMSGLVIAHARTPVSPLRMDLIEVLSHAKGMYLQPTQLCIARDLLDVVITSGGEAAMEM